MPVNFQGSSGHRRLLSCTSSAVLLQTYACLILARKLHNTRLAVTMSSLNPIDRCCCQRAVSCAILLSLPFVMHVRSCCVRDTSLLHAKSHNRYREMVSSAQDTWSDATQVIVAAAGWPVLLSAAPAQPVQSGCPTATDPQMAAFETHLGAGEAPHVLQASLQLQQKLALKLTKASSSLQRAFASIQWCQTYAPLHKKNQPS